MKKILLIITIILTSHSVQAQIVNIPDVNFKNALINLGVDTNNDGEIQVSEAEVIVSLHISNENIASLEGIHSFTGLVTLDCRINLLTSLDLSQNFNLRYLYSNSNQLMSLDVTQNLNLEFLGCHSNQLTSLDVTQNLNLVGLQCYDNQLASLDLTRNTNLGNLFCSSNQLTRLDLSQNLNLQILGCYDNQLLSSLNIKNGNNQNMERMWAFDNPNLTCIEVDDETATYQTCDIVNFSGWCKDSTANYSEDCLLGNVDLNDQNLFTFYPNPTQKLINLNIPLNVNITSLNIFSLNGDLVLKKENNFEQVDLSNLMVGIYLIKVETDDKIVVKKLVKK